MNLHLNYSLNDWPRSRIAQVFFQRFCQVPIPTDASPPNHFIAVPRQTGEVPFYRVNPHCIAQSGFSGSGRMRIEFQTVSLGVVRASGCRFIAVPDNHIAIKYFQG